MNFVFFRAKNFVPNNITLLQNDEKMNEYVTHKIQFRWLKWKKKKIYMGMIVTTKYISHSKESLSYYHTPIIFIVNVGF